MATLDPNQARSPDADADLTAISTALVRIRRRQGRRVLGRAAMEAPDAGVTLDQVAVLDAVDERAQAPGGEVTVGDVAERLSIDPSRASRVVAATIDAGYLRRTASQGDGRRICLELTAAGHEILAHAQRSRRALVDELVRDWSPQDRADLARLLTRFTEALSNLGVDR